MEVDQSLAGKIDLLGGRSPWRNPLPDDTDLSALILMFDKLAASDGCGKLVDALRNAPGDDYLRQALLISLSRERNYRPEDLPTIVAAMLVIADLREEHMQEMRGWLPPIVALSKLSIWVQYILRINPKEKIPFSRLCKRPSEWLLSSLQLGAAIAEDPTMKKAIAESVLSVSKKQKGE